MRIALRCDCGDLSLEESVVSDEFDQTAACGVCGNRYIITVTRLPTEDEQQEIGSQPENVRL